MTLPRNALATALIAVCATTGLTACGGSDALKVADAKFISKCRDQIAKNPNANVKADGAAICKCIQDKLKAQGLGDKAENSNEVVSKQSATFKACGVRLQTGTGN